MPKANSFSILNDTASNAAKRLLGCELERVFDGIRIRVRIVETEAYDQTDAASHSYKGRTARTESMFGPAGHLYVYFTYGMHYCANIVVGEEGCGAAVLIRAVEPLEGDQILQQYRPDKNGVELTNGPAKLCQALNIDTRLNGHNLEREPLKLIINPEIKDKIISTKRIGIRLAKDVLWRFYIDKNSYISKT